MSTAQDKTEGATERALFVGALERSDPTERADYLRRESGGNEALRRRVEELLREQNQLGGFLEKAALASAPSREQAAGAAEAGPHGTALLAHVTEQAGDRIDRYKLLQKIGEGGCGVVYMAEQEHPVRRRVALKILKLGMDTRSVIARFEAERQALAMMDHPNIAKVLDAGATGTGRPYFVMELVRGVRLTEYCDDQNLSTEARLELFIEICHAIQHAHQKGIIHRDIKPSNILVTLHDSRPVPKVIDFGIAKAMDQRLTDKTLFTEYQSFIGTPAYMSPEQAEMSGLDIDTRSDIYALGVLLYELLIGTTPFDPETLLRAGLDECRRTLREEEPVRPSTRLATMVVTERTTTAERRRTEPVRLIHQLRGDLDWIAMKCLEKDRGRRYATANDLAQDVRQPVLARPPSNLYRLQKLWRRHRRAGAAIATIAATLVIGAGVSAWQAFRATRAERTALGLQQREVRLRRQAELEKTSARLNEYVADINLAQQSLLDGNYGRAVQLLQKHRSREEEPDLRGFEWRYLWELGRGDPHVALPAAEGPIECIAISPKADLAAVGLHQEIQVWNLKTRALVTTLPKGGMSVAFFPDGSRLASASMSSVRIWKTAGWVEEKSLPENSGPLALSADGSRLVTTRRDGVSVWATATWMEEGRFDQSWAPLALSPDGSQLVTDTPRGLVLRPIRFDSSAVEVVMENSTNLFARAPSLPPGASTVPMRFLMRFGGDRAAAFSPDGKTLVAARNNLSDRGVFVLNLWDVRSGREAGVMPEDAAHVEHSGAITALAFMGDGRTLVTASRDHSIHVWDFPRRQHLTARRGHLSEVSALAVAGDGEHLMTGSKDGALKLWSTRGQRQEDVLTGVRHPLAFSRDSRTLAGLTRDGTSLVFVNLATAEVEQQFELDRAKGRTSPFGLAAAISEDLRLFAYGRDDGTVRLWDMTARETNTLVVGDGPIESLLLSPDGRTLLTRSRGTPYQRWDLRTGTNSTWAASGFRTLLSPNQRVAATQGRGNEVHLLDATSLATLQELREEESPAAGLIAAFSADSSMLAVAYQDDAIRLWDTRTGDLVGLCIGHKQGIRSVAFSPDGKTLATTSDDSTIKFWHVATQQELISIRDLGATLTGLMFSPDGHVLVGGSGAFSKSGGLRFFRAPTPHPTDAAR